MARARPNVVWFRHDLRLADNPALEEAARRGAPLIALYVLDDETPGRWRPGGAARWWLHGSLEALGRDLAARGLRLVLRRGIAARVVREVVEESGAGAVFWNRGYAPATTAADAALEAELGDRGIEVWTGNAALLAEPWTLKTRSGGPFKVFTPFWKALRAGTMAAPRPEPSAYPTAADVAGEDLEAWRLRPTKPDWASGLREAWTPGEAAARQRLADFLAGALADYDDQRDRPDVAGTSRLSPHLHWGEISPRQVWAAVEAHREAAGAGAEAHLRQLGWREFCVHQLHHWPDLPERNWRRRFDAFPWADDPAGLAAWQRGRTGYPFVDAGLRELWATGWMHNRARMIAASFLVKHLLVPWQAGEAWFWDTLVDADLANNAAGWQWVAGCGADAAPYFRIFNPVVQGERFDPRGSYVRRWLPELAKLPTRWLHKPWQAPEAVRRAAGVRLGATYPEPIVDHACARRRALAAFEAVKATDPDSGS